MNYLQEIEKDVLLKLREWRLHPEYPGSSMPIEFPGFASDIPSAEIEPSIDDEVRVRLIRSHLDIMEERGLIAQVTHGGSTLEASIKPKGLDRLSWHEDQEFRPRFLRSLQTSFGILITSVILPILMAILTAWALEKFGL